jgi:hypothetical protein
MSLKKTMFLKQRSLKEETILMMRQPLLPSFRPPSSRLPYLG